MGGAVQVSIIAPFIQHLLSQQAIANIVGARIRPMRGNQQPIKGAAASQTIVGDPLARIVVQEVSNPRNPTLLGATTLSNPRVQVDATAATYKAAKELAEALRNSCDGYRGWMGSTFVDSCLLEDERDFNDPSPGLDGAETFGVSMDFIFQHQEALPNAVPVLE